MSTATVVGSVMNWKIFFLVPLIWVALRSSAAAQDVTVVDFNGLKPLLHRDNDTTYIVNFWATWCKPCVEELPYFAEAEQKLSGGKYRFIMVSMDFRKTLDSRVRPFIKANKMPGQAILLDDSDANAWIPQVDGDWDGAIPVTLIYKGQSRKFVNSNFESTSELLKTIQSLN